MARPRSFAADIHQGLLSSHRAYASQAGQGEGRVSETVLGYLLGDGVRENMPFGEYLWGSNPHRQRSFPE
jgi:hypothetical protein